jgi:hypothetical protein
VSIAGESWSKESGGVVYVNMEGRRSSYKESGEQRYINISRQKEVQGVRRAASIEHGGGVATRSAEATVYMQAQRGI